MQFFSLVCKSPKNASQKSINTKHTLFSRHGGTSLKTLFKKHAYNEPLNGNTTSYAISPKITRKVAVFLTLIMILLAFLSGFVVSIVISATQTSTTLSSVGTLKAVGVGVYWDSSFTNKTTAINWGTLDPGTQKSFTMYIRNEGNSAITLSQSTSNWNPSGSSNYLTLTWNYNGQTINAGANIQVTLTLTVSASITGVNNFNFDIIIVGSG